MEIGQKRFTDSLKKLLVRPLPTKTAGENPRFFGGFEQTEIKLQKEC